MNNDKVFVNVSLTLEDVDVVLNALEEKALSVHGLRASIYEAVKKQVSVPETQVEVETKKNTGSKKKGKRK